jgi:hypothetical protein
MDDSARIPGRRRSRDLFWPVLLIGVGVLMLLSNLEALPGNYWAVIWRLWPLLLVAVGLVIMVGGRGALGSAFGALLALALVVTLAVAAVLVENDPAVLGGPTLQSHRIEHPVNGVRQAGVRIDFRGGDGVVFASGQSPWLIEGEITTYAELLDEYSVSGDRARVNLGWSFFQSGPALHDIRREHWSLGLNRDVTYDLELRGSSGSYNFDLRELDLRSLNIRAGSGMMTVALPERGGYQLDLKAGSGSVLVEVHEGMAVRVDYDAGSGSLDAPELTRVSGDRRDGVFETPGFNQSGSFVIINLDGGSGTVSIR